ncbi:MAG: molybdate ABC transporter substrate-binding protein [Syntrophomonadaceae bacterium]|nr:molybdate ABC transporter substrate-binding protein [Syntrophomonadaceae bacterium]
MFKNSFVNRFGVVFLLIALFFTIGMVSPVQAGEIRVLLNDKALAAEVQPVLVGDRVLVPLRVIAENLGADIRWDDNTRMVTVLRGDNNVQLSMNDNTARRNGTPVSLDTLPMIVNGRTLVPLRFVSETLGARADWNAAERTVRLTASPIRLTVSAAASLKDALDELITMYQEKRPVVRITPNYAASGALQRQIEEGAPADMFISAAKRNMDILQEKGLLIEGTRTDLLGNTLVLVGRQGLRGVGGFNELVAGTVRRIGVGDPGSVPAGLYARESLTAQGLWDRLQPKFVFGNSVRQVLAWVEAGDADAGFVYLSDAKIAPNVSVLATAPPGSHSPIVYPAAALRRSQEPFAARDFLDFLRSAQADAVFERYGFAVIN